MVGINNIEVQYCTYERNQSCFFFEMFCETSDNIFDVNKKFSLRVAGCEGLRVASSPLVGNFRPCEKPTTTHAPDGVQNSILSSVAILSSFYYRLKDASKNTTGRTGLSQIMSLVNN